MGEVCSACGGESRRRRTGGAVLPLRDYPWCGSGVRHRERRGSAIAESQSRVIARPTRDRRPGSYPRKAADLREPRPQ
eukprot:873074-Prymnesium_polylepis.1